MGSGRYAKLRRGKTVYYSYEACGSNDTFTLGYNKILGRSRWTQEFDLGRVWEDTAFCPEFQKIEGYRREVGTSPHVYIQDVLEILR